MNLVTRIAFLLLFGYILTKKTEKLPFNKDFIKNEHIDAIYQRCIGVCNEKYCKMYASCRPVNRTSKLKKLDIYFQPGVKLEAPVLLEVKSYEKFATVFRPLMLALREEICQLLLLKTHPLFNFVGYTGLIGNLLDPCPISGHRYQAPKYTTTWISYLVPVGEWRIDFILSKDINGSKEHIFTISDYVEIKATGATEF